MRMLIWISGHITKDKLRNDCIQENIGVAPIEEKMMEVRLRWFGHVQRRSPGAPIIKVDQMVFSPRKRSRGRPKKTLGEIIKRDF